MTTETTALTLPERASAAAQRRQREAIEAQERAEAERQRQAEEAERKRIADARAKTNAIRGEIDALLDEMTDDELTSVVQFIVERVFASRREAA